MLTGAGNRGLSTLPSRAVMAEGAQQTARHVHVRDRSARSAHRRRPPAPAAGGYWPGPGSGRPSRRNRNAAGRRFSRRPHGCAPAVPGRCRRRRRSARPRSGRPPIRRSPRAAALRRSRTGAHKLARTLSLPYLATSSCSRFSPSRSAPSWPRMSPSTSSGVRLLAAMMRSMSVFGAKRALIAHRRQMQAFVEDLARLARAASRHRAADVALVRDRAAEAEQRAADEHRRDHRHIGRMRAAALIGMVDQEGVALGDRVAECRRAPRRSRPETRRYAAAAPRAAPPLRLAHSSARRRRPAIRARWWRSRCGTASSASPARCRRGSP